jgi:hypothetical protein
MQEKSRLNRKITRRVIIIGSTTLAVILVVSYFIFVPQLKERAVNTAQTMNAQIIQQTDYLLTNIKVYAESVANSDEFKQNFINYLNKPSNQNYNLVCLNLNKLASLQSDVRGILVETGDGTVFNSVGHITEADTDILKSEWYKKI